MSYCNGFVIKQKIVYKMYCLFFLEGKKFYFFILLYYYFLIFFFFIFAFFFAFFTFVYNFFLPFLSEDVWFGWTICRMKKMKKTVSDLPTKCGKTGQKGPKSQKWLYFGYREVWDQTFWIFWHLLMISTWSNIRNCPNQK